MKKFIVGLFSLFLVLVNTFIVSFFLYHLIATNVNFENTMLFLWGHAFIALVTGTILFVAICSSNERIYSFSKKFFAKVYHAFIIMHLIGIVYFSCVVSWRTDKFQQRSYRIFIFYMTIDLGVFWWIYHPAMEVLEENKAEASARKGKAKLSGEEKRLLSTEKLRKD